MKKFAFVFFLLLFIAAACSPVFSCTRWGRDRGSNAYYIQTRSHTHWLGGRSSSAWHGLFRSYEASSKTDSDDSTDTPGGGKSEDTVVSK